MGGRRRDRREIRYGWTGRDKKTRTKQRLMFQFSAEKKEKGRNKEER
jgi:hypothetical protein